MAELPADVTAALADPEREFGKYTLVRPLGKGGMGEVHLGWERGLKRFVAIKLLKEVDEEGLRRFEREAQLAANLHHPNIATVFGAGRVRDRYFIAMQYVEGRTAEELGSGGVDGRRAAEIGRQVAQALDVAHRRDIIHRDVTPRNIIVEPDGKAVLTDFGIARRALSGDTLTQTGILIGTPGYMSPEQTGMRSVDTRSDLYSLGATLYFLVTQSAPFTGDDTMMLLNRIREEEPTPPSRLNPAVPAELERIILKALEKDASRRYQTGEEMAADLARFLAGERVRARPSSALEKWLRRRSTQAGVAVVAAVLVALLVGRWSSPTPPDFDELREAVTQYYVTGRTEGIGRLIETAPEAPEKHYWVARYLLREGKREEARARLDRAAGYAPAHLMRATLRLREYALAQAERLAKVTSLMLTSPHPIPIPEVDRRLLEEGRADIEEYRRLRAREKRPADEALEYAEGVLAFSGENWAEAKDRLGKAQGSPFLAQESLLLLAITRCALADYAGSDQALGEAQLPKPDERDVRTVLSYIIFTHTLTKPVPGAQEKLLAHLAWILKENDQQFPKEKDQHPLFQALVRKVRSP